MRYKLITLPKETNKLPISWLPSIIITLSNVGDLTNITPNTTNGVDQSYTFTFLQDVQANMTQLHWVVPVKTQQI